MERQTTYNIMIAFEINHYLKRKIQGKVGYKLDMSKAYIIMLNRGC